VSHQSTSQDGPPAHGHEHHHGRGRGRIVVRDPEGPAASVTTGSRALNFATFPVRALAVLQSDRGRLQSLRSERFSYVAEEAVGHCLDIGCGPENRFIRRWHQDGVGIDVFGYEGLDESQVVPDMTSLPYDEGTFDTVTLIAALNHVPEPLRVAELREMRRVLRPGGRLVLTMGNALAERAVHQLVHFYSHRFGTHEDMDGERGMEHEESFSVSPREIRALLAQAGFTSVRRRRFWTQWGLNSLYVAVR
jgi:SAM-dependent methyltransferase